MTIYHIEGFDVATTLNTSAGSAATVAYIKGKYSDVDVESGNDVFVKTGFGNRGKSIQWGDDSSALLHYLAFPVPNLSTIWCSFHRRQTRIPNLTNSTFWQIRDATTPQVTFTTTGNLGIVARNGTYLGTILGVSKPCLWGEHWTWLKFKVTIHNTTGEIKIWADGQLVLDLTGIDTQASANAYGTSVRFWGTNSAVSADTYQTDNIIIADADPGDWKIIEHLMPNASGSNADFISSGGGGAVYTNVDDIPRDSDTTYNYSSSTNDIDTFNAQNLSYITSAIIGLEHCMDARHTGTANSLRLKLISATVTDNGSTEALTSSYATYYKIHETDPYTTSAWTTAGIGSMEIGYENMT